MSRGQVTVESIDGAMHVVVEVGDRRFALTTDGAEKLIDLLMQAVAITRFDPAVPAARIQGGGEN